MTRAGLSTLRAQLTDRDHDIIADVAQYRLLTTRHIQRLRFNPTHPNTNQPSPVAAARACTRTLTRLRDLGVLRALERRIGGARAGSAGYVWYLGPAGDRLHQALHPDQNHGRRNYREPSRHFVEHTLAIAELAIGVIEAARAASPDVFEVIDIATEPASWQTSLTPYGATETLKPDLRLITASGDYEHHWYLEIDLATEHLPVIARQCAAYQRHRATGRYQAQHGLYPAVIWVVPNQQRQRSIAARITRDPGLDDQLFTVATTGDALRLITSGTHPNTTTHPDPAHNPQKGGPPCTTNPRPAT